MENLENKDLLAALQNGSKTAFETIYHRLADRLLQYIHNRVRDRLISEEIVQEIFVSLYLSQPGFQSYSALEGYLFKAAKYQILNHIRSEKVRQRYTEHLALFVAQEYDNSIEQLMDMNDIKAAIEQHIKQLPPKCQEAFRLSRFMHKSITETAQLMGISTRTVENYITQALRHLRKNLSQYQWTVLLIYLSSGLSY